MQTTTYTWITNCQKENAYVSVMISPVGVFLLLPTQSCQRSNAEMYFQLKSK